MAATPRKKTSVRTALAKTSRSASHEAGRKSGVRKDVLSSEVLDRAVGLFAQRGFAGTSLKDVADAVGLSRPAIYYYFASKDALLEELLTGVTVSAARILDSVEKRSDLSPIEKIGAAARDLVLWVTERRLHFIAIDRSENELPPAILARHREAKRRVLSGMMHLIDEAVASGEARAVDSRVTAFAIIGMCNWTAWWFVPDGELTAPAIAERIADLAMHSVRRARPANGSVRDVRGLTSEIRDILGLIDRAAT